MIDSSHNMRTNKVEFQYLLLKLQDMKKDNFTSVDVAIYLKTGPKRVSNDLARLHRMGFLRRKRQKRFCISNIIKFRNAKWCHKGYEYNYTITRQGLSYINYVKKAKPIEDSRDLKLQLDMLENLPEDVKNEIVDRAISKLNSRYKGPHREPFPIDIDILTLLMSENLRLRKQNSELTQKFNICTTFIQWLVLYTITTNNRFANNINNSNAIIYALIMNDIMALDRAHFELFIKLWNERNNIAEATYKVYPFDNKITIQPVSHWEETSSGYQYRRIQSALDLVNSTERQLYVELIPPPDL